ncbi:chromate transporter [Meiothermus taiwanensis]|jgi:chromate transporter|uniref:Chromate transporter n=1 Tax=Meiothermus taiwanensis WR-220 TaxID=1339250 RepID=A0ABN5LSL7_9DEIN|nr:chromate transporter [Meiothermus taiwanensis]AWR85315.1 chromate transporter [Meiothermus taiwanensis WR-220]KIQ55787.1 chromate transporter [Meiothermus taiwanensis]
MNVGEILEVFLAFLRFGVLSFGGGMANLPEMARVIIGNGWVTRQEFADGFALGQFVPGPNMLAVLFYGLSAAGLGGALAAALGMFLPGAVGAMWLVWGWAWMSKARWSRALRKALVPISMGLSASMVLVLVQLSVDTLFWGLGVLVACYLIYRGLGVVWVIAGGGLLGLLLGLTTG